MKSINENDPIFANFELLQKGIIIRANKEQRLEAIILSKKELENVLLIGFRIQIKHWSWGRWNTKIVHRGKLEVKLVNGVTIHFAIPVHYFPSILKFLRKDFFLDKFNFAISTDAI